MNETQSKYSYIELHIELLIKFLYLQFIIKKKNLVCENHTKKVRWPGPHGNHIMTKPM